MVFCGSQDALSKELSFEQALNVVAEHLPLRGYSREEWVGSYTDRHRGAYEHIIATIERHVSKGGSILDFGAGICDKTVLTQLRGYRCVAADDFGNPLNAEPGYSDAVFEFARSFGVDVANVKDALPDGPFDMVMLHDVIEHLHDSPRELLNDMVERLRTGGFLFITVPSAVNIRKRIDVLRGRTNLPRYDTFYWYPGPWRGHVREYTKGDLEALNRYLGLELVELHACHHMLSVVPRWMRPFYLAATALFPGWRDSWCYVGRKPGQWKAVREVPPQALEAILKHLNR
jgi:SAM-dependent methyltransferase